MTRFNKTRPGMLMVAPIRTSLSSTTRTAEGGTGYEREPRSELFLLAVTNLVGQKTFYETAAQRDSRFSQLIRTVAAEPDGVSWLGEFLPWLRSTANMRTAPLVGAVELVAARRGQSDEGGQLRRIVAAVLQRADEPGEMIAYWAATHGGTLPKALKRGIAMALPRLYNEYAVGKYDTAGKEYRFARVLDLTHPTRDDIYSGVLHGMEREALRGAQLDWEDQAGVTRRMDQIQALFAHLGDRMRGRDTETPQELAMLRQREELFNLTPEQRRQLLVDERMGADSLRQAGMDWRATSSWWNGPLDATFWRAVIPTMGYQALLSNLRNLDQVSLDDATIDTVAARLADPAQVRKSKLLPMQFLSAYRATKGSLNWGRALTRAIEHSLDNIPALAGDTLILVDTSSSMNERLSDKGDLLRWDAAVVFALAVARRCERARVVSFSSAQRFYGEPRGPRTAHFELTPGEALLSGVDRWQRDGFFLGGGTDTAAALRQQYTAQDRVVIVTDEQAGVDPTEISASVPSRTPLITFNLAGHHVGHAPSGTRNRVTIGGFNDAAFGILAALDARQRGARWPWETAAA